MAARRTKEDNMEISIRLTWDRQAGVWIAGSDDVPGLVLEDPSREALLERLRQAVPELLELNGKESGDVTMTVMECG